MKVRELASIIIVVVSLLGFLVAHEAVHVVHDEAVKTQAAKTAE